MGVDRLFGFMLGLINFILLSLGENQQRENYGTKQLTDGSTTCTGKMNKVQKLGKK